MLGLLVQFDKRKVELELKKERYYFWRDFEQCSLQGGYRTQYMEFVANILRYIS